MSWTSWPATLQPCAACSDQPRTHGPLCGWCDAMAEDGAQHAANELSEAEVHEHFRFHARRISHAESRYPDGSMREWAPDEPMPARPDTEATAQWANLAAFAHLCGQCDNRLDAAEQRPRSGR